MRTSGKRMRMVAVLTGLALVAGCSSGAEHATDRVDRSTTTAGGRPVDPRCPWVGSTAPVEQRVRQVLARMTEAEKLGMVHGADSADPFAGRVVGVPRLCIPALRLADGPAGVRNVEGATQLPAPIALASTWDPGLARRYGEVLGAEVRAAGANVSLAPTINLVRDPRWGRSFESFGEDPLLTARLSTPEIQGMQAQDVIAQVKHFAAYNQEIGRAGPTDDARVTERVLRELYLPAFESAVTEGRVGSIMCAYSTVNGVPACANRHLLDQILKRDWGFDGFVTTDWWTNLGGPDAANQGLDVQMPDDCFFGPQLAAAIDRGDVPAARLDDMVARVLRPMFALGVVDHPVTDGASGPPATPAHRALAREVAAAGTVLLRNDDLTLPIDGRRTKTIAVIGPWAADRHRPAGGGSAAVGGAQGVDPLEGIRARAGSAVEVVYDDGADPTHAARVAAAADVAVVVVSRADSEGIDHATLGPGPQAENILDAVASAQPRTVLVLNSGTPLVLRAMDRVPAVLQTWYPGEAAGSALADVLFGDVNPSGKLPVTFPRRIEDLPTAAVDRFPGAGGHVRYDEGLLTGYRWYASKGIDPMFAFGHGLSYTTFELDRLRVGRPAANGRTVVTARVTNTGSRAGAEVAQLYLEQPGSAHEPPLRLAGFQRVELAAGASASVRFELDARSLSHWDEQGRRWVAPAGTYRVRVGDAADHLPLTATLRLPQELRGPATGPDLPSPPPPAQPEAEAACPQDVIRPRVGASATVLANP